MIPNPKTLQKSYLQEASTSTSSTEAQTVIDMDLCSHSTLHTEYCTPTLEEKYNHHSNSNSSNNSNASGSGNRKKYHEDPIESKGSLRYNFIISYLLHKREKCREFLAEFIGTFVLVLFINGVSAEQTLGVGGTKSWLVTSFGNGAALLFGQCISGHISASISIYGAHLNPAVTLTFWTFSHFPTQKVLTYISAQILGAFVGAGVLYGIIQPAINEFDGGVRQILGPQGTAGIFATYPPLYVGIGPAMGSEIVGTMLLLLIIMSSGKKNNMPYQSMQGFVVSAGLFIITLSLTYTSGFSLNPARDIGPRLFTLAAGWGVEVFTASDYYALVPIFGPIVGGLFGGLLYKVFIDHQSIDDQVE
ncbi:aquaporin-like protein [Phycomyces blakesleeanus]|uniref:Aquaporin-like protein n=1 Tax=Phycomyces blakesleeanus TaxID=4837 RepID=A0ABR3B0I6_PHYBL